MTESHEKLTTDPPRPPGTPDVDDLVGDPVPTGEQIERTEPDDEDVTDDGTNDGTGDTVSVEPPD
jgi:hypothetical protein